MDNFSMIGIAICVVLGVFFCIELFSLLFSIAERNKRKYIPLHLFGLITVGLVEMYAVCETLAIDGVFNKKLITATVICAFIFFIALGWDSLRVERKIQEGRRNRRCNKSQLRKRSQVNGERNQSIN